MKANHRTNIKGLGISPPHYPKSETRYYGQTLSHQLAHYVKRAYHSSTELIDFTLVRKGQVQINAHTPRARYSAQSWITVTVKLYES